MTDAPTTTVEANGTVMPRPLNSGSLSTDLRASRPEEMNRLVQELERISKTAKDYVVPARKMSMEFNRPSVNFSIADAGIPPLSLNVGRVAHEQIAERLDIPRAYYRKMLDGHQSILAANVNHWLYKHDGAFLLRTLDGGIRAALSDVYRQFDNYDLFFHTYGVGREMGAVLQRLELSDERFYMRLLLPDFAAKIDGRVADLKSKGVYFARGVNLGDGTFGVDGQDGIEYVIPAIVASNSEVGRGGLDVEIAAYSTICVNYLMTSQTLHRVHRGSRIESGLLSRETMALKDQVVWAEVADMTRAAFDEDKFRSLVLKMNEAQATQLVDAVEAVDTVVKHYGISEDEKQSILNDLMTAGRGPTVWGLVNAVTNLAHERGVESAVAAERIGGQMLEQLPELVPVRKIG